jgi:hypothetical protein
LSRRIAFAEVDLPLRLRAPDGPLDLAARELAYIREDGRPAECRLALVLDRDGYERVDRQRLLGLTPEARGPGADRFRPAGPVRIDARLAGDLAPELLAAFPEPRAAAERLGELSAAGAPSPLLRTEAWRALSVAAEREAGPDGSLAEGYATAWAGELAPRLPMLAAAEEALERRGWTFEPLTGESGLRWRMASPAGAWWCAAIAREEEGRFAVYAEVAPVVPGERRAEAALLVARLNLGLPIGNWELDADSGALRFKAAVDVAGDRLSVALAGRLMERAAAAVDAGLPALAELGSSSRTTR